MELNLFSNPRIEPEFSPDIFLPLLLVWFVPGAQVCGVSALGLNINSRLSLMPRYPGDPADTAINPWYCASPSSGGWVRKYCYM